MDVLSLVGDVDLPLPDLVRLELGRVDAVVAGDGAVERPVERGVGGDDDTTVTRLRRVDLKIGQGRSGQGRTGQIRGGQPSLAAEGLIWR